MNLKQGEVQPDAEARSHGDQPGAVGRVGVLFRVRRREDGAVVRRDVAAARHWWRKEGRGQGIFIYQRAVNTSGQIQYSAAIVVGWMGGGWGWIFSSPWSSAPPSQCLSPSLRRSSSSAQALVWPKD